MVKQSQLNRGKKWKVKLAELKFKNEQGIENTSDDIKWMESQKAIMEDIEAYENSTKAEETKSKSKK